MNADNSKLYRKGKDKDDILDRDYSQTNALTLPRMVREVAISDYDDLDINTSHQTMLIALCRQRKVPVPARLIEYVKNKQSLRETV